MLYEIVELVLIGIVGVLILFVKYKDWNKIKKERILGYRVEFIPDSILRGKPDQFAVVYYEKDRSEWFYGNIVNSEYVLNLSFSPDKIIPVCEKELIKQRVKSELNIIFNKFRIKIINDEDNQKAR